MYHGKGHPLSTAPPDPIGAFEASTPQCDPKDKFDKSITDSVEFLLLPNRRISF